VEEVEEEEGTVIHVEREGMSSRLLLKVSTASSREEIG